MKGSGVDLTSVWTAVLTGLSLWDREGWEVHWDSRWCLFVAGVHVEMCSFRVKASGNLVDVRIQNGTRSRSGESDHVCVPLLGSVMGRSLVAPGRGTRVGCLRPSSELPRPAGCVVPRPRVVMCPGGADTDPTACAARWETRRVRNTVPALGRVSLSPSPSVGSGRPSCHLHLVVESIEEGPRQPLPYTEVSPPVRTA